MSSSSAAMTEELQCSICLDVFNDPVTTPCGHNFCKICLKTYWDFSENCRCPNCNKTFNQRPDLKINTTLREVVHQHKQTIAEKQLEVIRLMLVARIRSHKWFLIVLVGIFLLIYCFTGAPTLSIEKLSKTALTSIQQYAVDVTLDPDTANSYLILSDDNKQVRYGGFSLWRRYPPDNPKRFDYSVNVLGKQGFSSGRFYFEVQVMGKTDWTLGVARETVNRKGRNILTPVNGFWTVALMNENEYRANAGPAVSLSLKVKQQKVGVFVDYEEGLVSFYDVKSKFHIYSFTDQSFNEKLYPYFSPGISNWGRNAEPLIITLVSNNQ